MSRGAWRPLRMPASLSWPHTGPLRSLRPWGAASAPGSPRPARVRCYLLLRARLCESFKMPVALAAGCELQKIHLCDSFCDASRSSRCFVLLGAGLSQGDCFKYFTFKLSAGGWLGFGLCLIPLQVPERPWSVRHPWAVGGGVLCLVWGVPWEVRGGEAGTVLAHGGPPPSLPG